MHESTHVSGLETRRYHMPQVVETCARKDQILSQLHLITWDMSCTPRPLSAVLPYPSDKFWKLSNPDVVLLTDVSNCQDFSAMASFSTFRTLPGFHLLFENLPDFSLLDPFLFQDDFCCFAHLVELSEAFGQVNSGPFVHFVQTL